MDSALDPAEALKRAIAAYSAGRLAEAEQLCLHILSAQRDNFDATHVLAVVQGASGKNESALANYDRAAALRPDNADVPSNRGNTLIALGRFDDAVKSFDRALALRPNFPEAFSNRGNALERLGRLDEALADYDHALALRPDYVDALCNRGNVQKTLKRYGEALASYDRALALRPDNVNAHNNRGEVLRMLGRYQEALASYDAALAVQPQNVMVHCNAASLRLLLGDFERGWAEYEWRWKKASVVQHNRGFTQPLWLGKEDIAGKTILIHSEQGLGDTIQFCRYLPLVAARGARVVFEVEPALRVLLTDAAGAAQVVAKGEPLPPFDVHCPLLSLPLAFGTRLDTVPAQKAYLRAPAGRAPSWQGWLKDGPRPRVGLVWAGNPRHERDRERSIPLRTLLPLVGSGATFVSLQKELRPEDAALLKERGDILHAGDRLGDFADTAALIAELDLVISVDTSVAHLAAALGKPTWILLTWFPDWRWLLGRDDSPWYPTARLFRQDESGAWDGVVARLREALAAFERGTRP